MHKNIIWVAGLVLALSVFSLDGRHFSVTSVHAEDNGMTQVRLVLKKLRGSMASMKDFDELEAIGMDKADVNRMRNAMKLKIKQMTADAVDLISAL